MTYFIFHLVFTLPALVIALLIARSKLRRAHFATATFVSIIALAATTPWDNWAVKQGIWSFDWERTTPVVLTFQGQQYPLPAEEYAFFILMTVLVCLVCVAFLPDKAQSVAEPEMEG